MFVDHIFSDTTKFWYLANTLLNWSGSKLGSLLCRTGGGCAALLWLEGSGDSRGKTLVCTKYSLYLRWNATIGYLRDTKLGWVGKHVIIVLKPTKS